MATLLAIKTRIRLQTNRDDIAAAAEAVQELTDAITDAIDESESELFWFNRASGTRSTVAATATVAMPTGMRFPYGVSYNGEQLSKAKLEEIEYRTETGQPTWWAENEGAIHLWPIPDAVYALSIFGTASVGIPAADGDSNIWTTEGRKLIIARTKLILYRDLWRDLDGMQAAAQQEGDALKELRKETRRRSITPRRGAVGDPWTSPSVFNINRGDY